MTSRRDVICAAVAGVVSAGLSTRSPADMELRRARSSADCGARPSGVLAAEGTAAPLIPSPQPALRRFQGYRYGAFIHWGPGILSGKGLSWAREIEVPWRIYDDLYKRFDPLEFDADEWIRTLKDCGFRYVTFVTKHHDGFAMWNTATTMHNIMHTPFARDALRELSSACHKHDLPLCLYYSIADLYQPDCVGARHANGKYLGSPGYSLKVGEKPDFGRYVSYMKAQLKELTHNYGPVAAWWFDGGWMKDWTYDRGVDLLRYMRSLQADTLTNNRVGCAYNGRVYMPTWFPTDSAHVGDFAVLEVDLPRFRRDIPWEYTQPANGRSFPWTPGGYGQPDSWINDLVRSACGDGNFLLGLEPAPSGRFDPELTGKLAESRVWLDRYGESVFETRGGPYTRTNVYGCTCRGTRIYLHVFDARARFEGGGCRAGREAGEGADSARFTLVLPALPVRITGSAMLNGGRVDVLQDASAVTVRIDGNDLENPSTIVILELESSAEEIHPIDERPVNRGVPVNSSNADHSRDTLASDGDSKTYWKADHGPSGYVSQPWLEYDLGRERSISRAILREGEYEGELANIHRFWMDIRTDIGEPWRRIADVTDWGFESSEEAAFAAWPINVFHPEIRFQPVAARYLRLTIVQSHELPIIHEFALYER